MKIGHTIDSEGYYTGDVLEGSIPDVTVICPDGFYRPKWDGTQWIEGGAAPEPVPIPPTDAERIAQLEAENTTLLTAVSQTSTDMQGFMDYYFAMHPDEA
jgi:glycine/D-amino acid oxidase-like deaminating enzyme